MSATLPIEIRPSPNHNSRQGSPIDVLLLHYTGMPDHEQALAWLCDPRSQVSAHYFVGEDGRILSLVPEEHRAWHAGASVWAGERDLNTRSIGIEIANTGHSGGLPPYPDVQIEAVIALCRDVVGRHPIASHRVLAHSDVAPNRKLDPGELFPWERLAAEGVGHWVAPAPFEPGRVLSRGAAGPAVESLQGMLALYGYGVDVHGTFDARTEFVVAAFQRHFRPARVDGIVDSSTLETLRRLLMALD